MNYPFRRPVFVRQIMNAAARFRMRHIAEVISSLIILRNRIDILQHKAQIPWKDHKDLKARGLVV
jgi:hypothetical protein